MRASHTVLPTYLAADHDAVIEAFYAALSRQSSVVGASRLNFISAYFLGKPYLNGALGEGPEALFDQSPLYRTDQFDCLTYIATVLALTFSDDLASFKRVLCDINYRQGVPRYHERHHFMSVDWNPCNATQGYIQDMTFNVVDAEERPIAKTAEAFIDRPNWMRQRTISDIKQLCALSRDVSDNLLKQLHEFSNALTGELAQTPYLPIHDLFLEDKTPCEGLWRQIPDGVIVEIVRPNWDLRDQIGTHLNVSHLGFAFWKEGTLIFRHASTRKGKVVDEVLTDYLRHCMEQSDTVGGINLQKVLCVG